jgi:hypothetical protein
MLAKIVFLTIFLLTIFLMIYSFYRAFGMGVNIKDLSFDKWKKILFTNEDPNRTGIDWLLFGFLHVIVILILMYLYIL